MVTILLAPARIEACGLDVAVGRGTDPDRLVGRRDADRLDPPDDRGIGDALAVLIVVTERRSRPLACVAGRGVADVSQALLCDGVRHLCGTVENFFFSVGLSEHLLD